MEPSPEEQRGPDPDRSPAPTGAPPPPVSIRPRRIIVYAAIASGVVLTTMVVVGLLLRGASRGVHFRVADQIGLIGIGVLLSAAIMTAARPRARADEHGLRIRNVIGERFFGWDQVVRIAFPPGSPWAQLILADDEAHPVMAIQVMDRQRAVEGLRAVRDLFDYYGPPLPPQPSAEALAAREQSERDAYRRPLGRLEIIDQEKAAKRPPRP